MRRQGRPSGISAKALLPKSLWEQVREPRSWSQRAGSVPTSRGSLQNHPKVKESGNIALNRHLCKKNESCPVLVLGVESRCGWLQVLSVSFFSLCTLVAFGHHDVVPCGPPRNTRRGRDPSPLASTGGEFMGYQPLGGRSPLAPCKGRQSVSLSSEQKSDGEAAWFVTFSGKDTQPAFPRC